MAKRKIKKHHWSLIAGSALIAAILLSPVNLFIAFILATKQKLAATGELVETTGELIQSLTITTKAATSLIIVIATLVTTWLLRKK